MEAIATARGFWVVFLLCAQQNTSLKQHDRVGWTSEHRGPGCSSRSTGVGSLPRSGIASKRLETKADM